MFERFVGSRCPEEGHRKVGETYATRTCDEVCKGKTAALTVSHPSHSLIYCGVGIQSYLVSARDNTLGGRLRLFEGLRAASEPRP